MSQPLLFPLSKLDWVDDFFSRISNYLLLRDEDDILILPPNRVYKLNPTGRAMLRHLERGRSIRGYPGLLPGSRAEQVNTFFSNLKAAYEGKLSDPDSASSVERRSFTFDFTRLPVLGEIAVTYRCNNRCTFCYAACGDRMPGETGRELSIRRLKRVIEIFRHDAKIPFFSFTGGEPLLRKELDTLVAYAGAKGLRANLVSNGTLATRERSRSLHDNGLLTAQISLESQAEVVHDRLAGVPGSWTQTLRGIENLMNAGISVQTNTTITGENIDTLFEFPSFLRGIGIERFAMNLFIPTGTGVRNHRLFVPYSAIGPVIDGIRHEAAANELTFYWYSPVPHCHYNPLAKGLGNASCAAMDGLISVSPVGDVLPCSSYPEPIGNLFKASFTDIWFSERAGYFKNKLYAPEECDGCGRFSACQAACPLYWRYAGTEEIADRNRSGHKEVRYR